MPFPEATFLVKRNHNHTTDRKVPVPTTGGWNTGCKSLNLIGTGTGTATFKSAPVPALIQIRIFNRHRNS